MKLRLINPKHYYNEFKQLLKFVITPAYNSTNAMTTSKKIEGTWTMFIVKLVLGIIVGVSIGIFYDAENKTTISMAERFSPLALFFVSVFALPLLEEIEFRLSLKFKPIFLALTLGALGYSTLSKMLYHAKLSDVYDHFIERASITVSIIIVTYFLFSIPKIKRRLERFWENNFKWILYFLCFGFAWVHGFNYEYATMFHLLLIPIITIDKLTSAFCYGYVRMKYGFLFSFGLHMCWNAMGFVVEMLTS